MLVKGYFVVKEIYDEYQAKKSLKKNNIKIKHQRPESKGLDSSKRTSVDQTSSHSTEERGDLQNNTLIKDIGENLNESVMPLTVSNLINQKRKKKINRKEKNREEKLHVQNQMNNNLEGFQVQDLEISSFESKDSSSSWALKGVFPQSTLSSNPLISETQPSRRGPRLQNQKTLELSKFKNLEASDL